MAAVPSFEGAVAAQPLDYKCKYTIFTDRPEGKVACLGRGSTCYDANITSIAFQKVDSGIVKAFLPADSFSPINWGDDTEPQPESPQHGQQSPIPGLYKQIQLGQPNHVTQPWREFTTVMKHAKAAMITRMTPPNAARPAEYLWTGFEENVWVGAPSDALEMIGSDRRAYHILEDIKPHLDNYQINPAIEDFLVAICSGLYTSIPEFVSLFKFLFPNTPRSNATGHQRISAGPSKPYRNGTLREGVVKCLAYGYWDRESTRRQDGRMLLPTKVTLGLKSRSRSPASDDDEDEDDSLSFTVSRDVVDPGQPNYHPRMNHIIGNPDAYVLRPERLHYYFESHKPDLILYEASVIQDQSFPAHPKEEVCAKIMFEIASYTRRGWDTLQLHTNKNTKHCVQSCLAGYGSNQDLMYGIIVVVDGLKLVKVERQQNQDGTSEYNISDTDLILWDQTDSLHALFEMIESIL